MVPTGDFADEKSTGDVSGDLKVEDSDKIDSIAERRIVRKVDTCLLPLVIFLFFLNYIDRSAVANANVAGFTSDLRLGRGGKYNIGLSLFYILYIIVEPFSNLTLKRVGGKWLPFMGFCFGITTIGTAFIKNYSQFLAARALLGVFEGSMIPGVAFLLSRFYRRHELVFRIGSFLVLGPSISGAFGGLLAAGLLSLPPIGAVYSWRKIFLVDGILTSGFSILVFILMPTGPESAWFFTPEERVLAGRRIALDQIGTGKQLTTFKAIKRGLLNINLWLCAAGFGLTAVSVISTSLFLPTIIQEFGHFNSVKSNLYAVPQYAGACIWGPLVCYASYRTRRHGLFIIISTLLSLIGYIMFLSTRNAHIRYGSTFFICLGANPAGGMYLAWITANTSPETARAIATALVPAIGSLGSVAASWAYLRKDAPGYVPGTILNVVCTAVGPVIALGIILYVRRENRIRDAGGRDYRLQGLSQEEVLDLGSRHPSFRYLE